MNPLIYVSVGLHFEVMNSEMFGGEGSVGYTLCTFGGVKNIEKVDEAFIAEQKRITAAMLNTSVENLTLISKEAYDFATEDDSERTEIDIDEDDDF